MSMSCITKKEIVTDQKKKGEIVELIIIIILPLPLTFAFRFPPTAYQLSNHSLETR